MQVVRKTLLGTSKEQIKYYPGIQRLGSEIQSLTEATGLTWGWQDSFWLLGLPL